jgi:Holliday junction resolvasome RuvABC ATP-dependent DNA helicase subunit
MKTNETTYTLPLIKNDSEIVGSAPLANIIGQTEVVKKLTFFVDSHSATTCFPTMIFSGSQGLGKTYMAQRVAEALGRELITINCGTIKTAEQFIEGVLIGRVAGSNPKTLLLDEAHELTDDVTTILLTLLNPNLDNKNILTYKNWNLEYDLSKINVILCTTDAHKIFAPLLDRCEEIYFRPYNNKELYAILTHYLPNVKLDCAKDDIAYAARGRARDAFTLAMKVNRYCIMRDRRIFDNEDWKNLKSIFGICHLGLRREEVTLLEVVEKCGPVSAANIAAKMGLNVKNIEEEIELRPRELGLVINGTRGRSLTEEGKEYLKKVA